MVVNFYQIPAKTPRLTWCNRWCRLRRPSRHRDSHLYTHTGSPYAHAYRHAAFHRNAFAHRFTHLPAVVATPTPAALQKFNRRTIDQADECWPRLAPTRRPGFG